ncbi:hypothetical protein LQZ19_12000 [Treponema primitia]
MAIFKMADTIIFVVLSTGIKEAPRTKMFLAIYGNIARQMIRGYLH